MSKNRENPNISKEQADFLETLSSIRHSIHSSPQHYFFDVGTEKDIDGFFAMVHSYDYFERMELPYPKDIINLMDNIKQIKQNKYLDIDTAMEQYAFQTEALNSLIERYLRSIDDDKGTEYCPSGMLRDNSINPIDKSIKKLKNCERIVKKYDEKLDKTFSRINKKEEKKHNKKYVHER